MKSTELIVAAAALSGLLIGTAARAAALPGSGGKESSVKKSILGARAVALDDKATDKHDCKGKNGCKGQGGCKTGDNGCKGKNSCKGHGGCKSEEEKKALA